MVSSKDIPQLLLAAVALLGLVVGIVYAMKLKKLDDASKVKSKKIMWVSFGTAVAAVLASVALQYFGKRSNAYTVLRS